MGIFKENDRVVYTGDTNEKLRWGWVQFPKLYPMRNGHIGICIHDDDDSWVAFDGDTAGKWLVTEDRGASWRPATQTDRAMMGTQLPGGDVLRSHPNPPASLIGVREAPFRFGNYRTILPIADDRALLAYSDFYVPCEDGLKHKGIKTVEIAVT